MNTIDFEFLQPDTLPDKTDALTEHVRSKWLELGYEQVNARIWSILVEWAIANQYTMDVCSDNSVKFTHNSLIPTYS